MNLVKRSVFFCIRRATQRGGFFASEMLKHGARCCVHETNAVTLHRKQPQGTKPNSMRPIDYALQQFAAKGYTAHDLREEKTTVQFTLTGPPLDTNVLGEIMHTAFEENIYAFAANGNTTTVKILL